MDDINLKKLKSKFTKKARENGGAVSEKICFDTAVGFFQLDIDNDYLSKKWTCDSGEIGWEGDPFERRTNLKKINGNQNVICIILESPHKDEFVKDEKFGIPAMETTGENIKTGLLSALTPNGSKLVKVNTSYLVVLLNAIPFQCSLGKPREEKKAEKMIPLLWEEGGEKNIYRRYLQCRLKKVKSIAENNNLIIINASGAKKNRQN